MTVETLLQFAISLGLGLLIGLQREWTAPHVAGIRSFALLTLFGTLSGKLAEATGNYWLIATGIFCLTALLILGTFTKFEMDEDVGLTTHVAALVMHLIGAALVFLPLEVPILLTGLVAVLLHWKGPIHAFVKRIGESELRAIFQLVLLALVILPVLPNEGYGPYDVLNPHQIWLIVVLICGISLASYLAYRFVGQRMGSLVNGILGGFISSTATTVSYSRRTRQKSLDARPATLVIVIASSIVFLRVFVEVGIVARDVLWDMLPPLATMMGIMAATAAGLYVLTPDIPPVDQKVHDPTELRTALVFGALYALVLLAVAAAQERFGNTGLFVVAALSGLTDMDAITLSTARFVSVGQISIDTGWRMILIGILSNLVFKVGIVALLGSRELLRRIAIVFGVALIAGVGLLTLWPTVETIR